MTPHETYMAIEAAIWRNEQSQNESIALAWRMAMLSRAQKMPSLKSLLSSSKPAKPLTGSELATRKKEFSDMAANINLSMINKQKRKQ